jgi:hypothetical protein
MADEMLKMFFGTAHRSSEEQSLETNVLNLLHLSFRGLLGSWVPEFIHRFSKYQQRLTEEFKVPALNFRVINVSQNLAPSSLHTLVSIIHINKLIDFSR